MRARLFILFSIVSLGILYSQNASDILAKVSNAYSENSGYVLTFTLNSEDVASKTTYSHDGKAYIKGNKFKIDVPDGVTWFDGKTQWIYLEESEEVNVTSPTGEELMAISPVALLNMYKKGFKLSYKGEVKDKGKAVYIIDMIPQKKGGDITKITLKVDKVSSLFTEITIKDKNGINNSLIIRKSEKGSNLLDSFFVFNKKNYPNVEVIDLR